MAAIDPGALKRVPGKLSYGCTDLTTAWPHGGTGLGLVKDLGIGTGRAYELIKGESWGEEVEDVLDLGEVWTMTGVLRDFNNDAVRKLFANTSAGAVTGQALITYPGSFQAGTLKGASAIKLVFTPEDERRHPFAIFYKAVPLVKEAAELAVRLNAELGPPFVFVAISDGATPRKVYAMGRKEDLSL